MMVFQEIVDRVRALSVEEQDNLIELIRQKREQQHGKSSGTDSKNSEQH